MSKTIELPDEIYQQLAQQATQRGVTLAQIIAIFLQEEAHARLTTAITRLQTQGVLLTPSPAAAPAVPDSAPIPMQGTPLSEVIIEERR